MKVEVHRDNQVFFQSFHETDEGAVPDDDVKVIGSAADGDTGTIITYIPSPSVYENAKINIPNLKKTLTTLSYFTKGFRIILIVDGERSEFYSEHGLTDGLNKELRIHSKPLSFYKEYPDCKVELALQWNKKPGELKAYANNLYVRDGGAFMTGFKMSLTKAFNSLSKGNFTGEQIRKYLDGFVSVKVKNVQFSNQAKTSLANPEARTATSNAISEALKQFVQLYPDDFKIIVEILKKEEKAEKAAERARNSILNAVKDVEKNQKRKVFASDKLKDAEFLGQDSILLCVEGNSAAASMANARDPQKYGILALRGKPINCLSNNDEKIFGNEEIKLLLSAMNITPGKYDSKKLRYGRIAICSDADSDGYHIGILLMAALQYLAPQFIQENRLCWLRSPLYLVKNGSKESYYYSDEEFNAVRNSVKGVVSRAKGLGALSEQQAHNSMFTEEFQRLDVLSFDEESVKLLNELMSENVQPRRDFVFNKIDFSEVRE